MGWDLGVPLSSISPHVQLEAVLWGIGTAVGEQTIFIILVCNNQLLHWVVENEFIWLVSLIHACEFVLPKLMDKVNKIRNKYLAAPPTSKVKMSKWDLLFASVWNIIVWLKLMNFFIKIVNATAQSYLKKQSEKSSATSQKYAPASKNYDKKWR